MIRKVILSRGRAETISTHKLLRKFDLVIIEAEREAYEQRVTNAENIVIVPEEISGLGELRNWVMDYYNQEDLIMLDDDIKHFTSLLAIGPVNYNHPDDIEQLLNNAYFCAMEAGATLFSFNQKCDVRKYRHSEPFSLNTWAGTVMGLCGKKKRFTTVNKLKVDADYALQCMLEDRIVWVDQRWSFFCKRDTNLGGNSKFRSQSRINDEIEFLKDKWGKHISIGSNKAKYSLKISVDRKQKL